MPHSWEPIRDDIEDRCLQFTFWDRMSAAEREAVGEFWVAQAKALDQDRRTADHPSWSELYRGQQYWLKSQNYFAAAEHRMHRPTADYLTSTS